VRLDCKRLSCVRCGPKRARRYQRAIAREAEARSLKRFATLTIDPARLLQEDSVDYIRECWNKFRTYLKRRFGHKVEYIAVLEHHKSGVAHLHVLMDRYIPKEWLDSAWNAVGGGFTWINYVDVHRVSAYISKYLTKALFGGLPSKKKRISTSRDIHLFEKRESTGWWFDRGSIEKHYQDTMNSRTQQAVNIQSDNAGLKSFEVVEISSAQHRGHPLLPFLEEPLLETLVGAAL
jgi:hypothetical protein